MHALDDGEFYLLPHGVDVNDPVTIKDTALSATDLRREIDGLAQHGRVLVLLDACRSGGAMASGQALAVDANRWRAALVGPNVTVLTSSSAAELSREDPRWGNGAFTKIVLEDDVSTVTFGPTSAARSRVASAARACPLAIAPPERQASSNTNTRPYWASPSVSWRSRDAESAVALMTTGSPASTSCGSR